MKVVVLAYACEPGRGSEPGVGWHWSLEQLDRWLDGAASVRVAHHVSADVIVHAACDPSFQRLLARSDLNLPDGMGVVWATRLLGQPAPCERVAGTDFLLAAVDRGRRRCVTHGFVGGSPATIARLVRSLEERFPGVAIGAAHSPPFRDVSEEGVAEDLRALGSDVEILWVGLGTPKQQRWAEIAASRSAARVIITVGAAFDFIAGTKSRAPRWMQRSGIEWVHRLLMEPRRLWRRYLVGNARFVVLAAREWVAIRRVH